MTDDLSILIADDNSAHADIIQRYLKDETVPWEIDATAEHHPSNCLSTLKDSDYDLVFLDYQFPGTTGFEVLDEMRREGLNVPIVMLTGQGDEEVAARAVSMDIKDYLRKEDLDTSTLVKSIKQALIPEGFMLDKNGRETDGPEESELLHKKQTLSSTQEIRQKHLASGYLWDVYNTVNAGIFVLDAEGRIQTMNRRFRSLLETKPAEHQNTPVETIFADPDDIDFDTLKQIVEDDRFLRYETTLLSPDGESIPVYLSARSLVTAGGAFQGVLCMVLEIAEDRDLQEDLLSFYSSSTFRGLLEPDGSLRNVNPSMVEIVDESEDELIGQKIWDTPWWSKNEEVRTTLKEDLPHLEPGESVGFRTVLYAFDGDKRYVNFSFQVVTDRDGQVVYLVMEGWDITENRRVLESYRESELEYSRLTEDMLDSTPTALWILDDEFNVAWINETTEEYFGFDRKEIIGRDKRELIESFHEDVFEEGKRFKRIVTDTYDDNTRLERFICHVLPGENREERWLEHTSQPITSGVYEGGRIEHYADITDLKQTQSELKTTLREKETLLKEIHHRVKNNLQIISSLLSLQSAKTESEKLKEAFEDSIHRIRSMAMIHEQLYQSDHLDTVDFRVYIENICEHLLDTHGVEDSVDLVLDVDPVGLNLDTAIACGLIINELVSNAIEHGSNPEGQNRVVISFGSSEDDMIKLQVTDYGEGYDGEIDVDSPESMGLTIVQSLAEYELDGTITFRKDPGFQVEVEFSL